MRRRLVASPYNTCPISQPKPLTHGSGSGANARMKPTAKRPPQGALAGVGATGGVVDMKVDGARWLSGRLGLGAPRVPRP